MYYRCTCGRGPCELPRFREQEISERLNEVVRSIHLPEHVARMTQTALQAEENETRERIHNEREQLNDALSTLNRDRNAAYNDKLKGEISADFWRSKEASWADEILVKKIQLSSLDDVKTNQRAQNLQSTLELAQIAHSKFLMANPFEQADLAKIVLSNCSVDAVSLYPTYRKPFDLITKRPKG